MNLATATDKRRDILVNNETVQQAQQKLEAFFATTTIFRDRENCIQIWRKLKEEVPRYTVGGEWDPLVALSFLSTVYAPTTAFKYAKIIRRHFSDSDFRNLDQQHVKHVMRQLQTLCNVAVKTNKAVAATSQQVVRLIGDLSLPEQRNVFQLWTTASRFDDARRWVREIFADHNMLKLTNLWTKADPTGKVPSNKWIPCSDEATMDLYERTGIDYWHLLKWIKAREPTLSCHSFRHGAVQALERNGFTAEQIQFLTWHKHSDVNISMQPYRTATPQAPASQTCAQLVLHLQQLIGFSNGRLEGHRQPRQAAVAASSQASN